MSVVSAGLPVSGSSFSLGDCLQESKKLKAKIKPALERKVALNIRLSNFGCKTKDWKANIPK